MARGWLLELIGLLEGWIAVSDCGGSETDNASSPIKDGAIAEERRDPRHRREAGGSGGLKRQLGVCISTLTPELCAGHACAVWRNRLQ